MMECEADVSKLNFCLFLIHTHTKEKKTGREKKILGGARKKEKKNHFLTSVYPHSVAELGCCNQPWRKAAPDPGRKLKAPQVRGH